jgi:hypothetical protein
LRLQKQAHGQPRSSTPSRPSRPLCHSREGGNPAPTAPRITDPFAVIPQKPDNLEMRKDDSGMTHLRLRVELTGLKKTIADLFNYDYTRKLELDENGSYYFDMVDGETPLRTIVGKMVSKLGKSRKDTEEMVVLFTRKLMLMNMIVLWVPENAQTRKADE